MSSDEMLNILRKTKVFEGISEEHLDLISTYGNLVTFVKGETIIREEQQGHPFFVVIKGQVEVVLPKQISKQAVERPTRIKISDVSPGYCIGEFSIIDGKPASASVIAIELCELIEIKRSDWEKIINSSDELAKNIYKNMLLIIINRSRQKIKELDICFY